MSPIIRIDNEVYSWLQKNAQPFEDTPNSILRKFAGLDASKNKKSFGNDNITEKGHIESAASKMTGEKLNKKWKVGAHHSLYHKDGHWYNNLKLFPGALFDPNGYILFKTKQDYLRCSYLKIGIETNVPKGIWSIPGYIRVG